MSEIKKNPDMEQEQNGGIDEMVRAVFGENAVDLDGEIMENGDPGMTFRDRDETGRGGFDDLLTAMEKGVEAHRAKVEERMRREAKASLAIGGLCALGVVSLIGAAVSGVWVPVAVGLGVCLSAAAGILVYRGMMVMLG